MFWKELKDKAGQFICNPIEDLCLAVSYKLNCKVEQRIKTLEDRVKELENKG